MTNNYDPKQPFQKIPDASRTTGLSQYILRRMVRDGSIPYVRSGRTYMINMRLLMQYLDEQSEMSVSTKRDA